MAMAEPLHPAPNTMKTELPVDIIFLNILPRLPARSVARFKFVSKQWHSYISTPAFAKIHTNINHHQNHHKLLVLSLSEPYKFHTIDCEIPKLTSPATRLVPFENAGFETFSIVASFHGMLCVGITKCSRDDAEYSHLILWNPLLGEYKKLSIAGADGQCYKKNKSPFGLYYSSSDDDYKLLRVTNFHAAYIYSLKSDSWRKAVEETYFFELQLEPFDLERRHPLLFDWFSYNREPTALLNEKLYFLKQTMDGNTVRNSYSILMFDTKNEKFIDIACPSFENKLTTCSSFMVHRDRIHLCVTVNVGCPSYTNYKDYVELWRMDEDGDWTKVLTYRPMVKSLWYFWPMHLMRNGNWLMHSVYTGCHVVELDMDKKTTDVVYPNINIGIDIPERGKFIETIVSPNQYTK